jgi:hypothetical protein
MAIITPPSEAEEADTLDTDQSEPTPRDFNPTIWLIFLIISLSFYTKPVRAESAETGDIQTHFRYTKYELKEDANPPISKPLPNAIQTI